MFASCGSLSEANQVFSRLLHRTVYTWNAIISAHIKLREAERVLQCFHLMLAADGVDPDNFVLSCMLKACYILAALAPCMLIHHYIIDMHIKCDTVLENSLLDTYGHCGSVDEAWKVFGSSSSHDVVSWSSIISAYLNQNDSVRALGLYGRMKEENVKADKVVFLSLLKASSSLGSISYGRMLHNDLIQDGLENDLALGSSLVDMYAKCGSIQEAHNTFNTLSHPSPVSWSSLIFGFLAHGHQFAVSECLTAMLQGGIEPDNTLFITILKACCKSQEIEAGRVVHAQIVEAVLEEDTVIESTITNMYVKNGCLDDARKVFESMAVRDEVAWATIIGGYAQMNQATTALLLLKRMEGDGLQPNISAFLSGLRACSTTGKVEEGMLLHDEILRREVESDESIGSCLVDMYAKYGDVEASRKVFNRISHPNEIAYGALIAGCAEHGEGFLALSLFNEMDMHGLHLDAIIYLYAVKSCSSLGTVRDGSYIHHRILKDRLECSLLIGNSLIEMYMKCSQLFEAQKVFEGMPSRDIVSWSALVTGYAQLADASCAHLIKHHLSEMQRAGFKANDVIFTSLLAAYSQAGQKRAGCSLFSCMVVEYGILPSIEHYTCMIDLLGRTGCFFEAQELIRTIPDAPNVISWTALLSSCCAYCNPLLGNQCFDQFVENELDDGSGYLLMLNTYANVDMWEDVGKLQELKSNVGALRKPGRAWIEVSAGVQEFVVGSSDKCLQPKLQRMGQACRKEGVVPVLTLVME